MNAKLQRFSENSANLERATTSATRPVANETSLGNIKADAVFGSAHHNVVDEHYS